MVGLSTTILHNATQKSFSGIGLMVCNSVVFAVAADYMEELDVGELFHGDCVLP